MKKMMTSAMALLLCLTMLFSFAACGGDNGNSGEQTVVGNWECLVDAGDLYSQMTATGVDDDINLAVIVLIRFDKMVTAT